MKKLLFIVLVLVLAFSTIGASLASVNALKAGETTSFWSGRVSSPLWTHHSPARHNVQDNSSVKVPNKPGDLVQGPLNLRLS